MTHRIDTLTDLPHASTRAIGTVATVRLAHPARVGSASVDSDSDLSVHEVVAIATARMRPSLHTRLRATRALVARHEARLLDPAVTPAPLPALCDDAETWELDASM